jgi:putative ABC transport system permease protein
MTRLRVLLLRLLDPLRRRPRDRRLDDELQAHLDLLVEEHLARGLSIEDARRAARRVLGNIDQIRADYCDQRGLPVLDALAQDVRFALRQTVRSPAFTMTAALILGLGIGVNNMFFTIVYAHTIRGLPIERVDRVFSIAVISDRTQARALSFPDFDDLRHRATTFSGLAAFTTSPVVVADKDHAPERVEAAFVSGEAFEVAGVQPVLGRTFAPADEQSGAAAVAVIGSALWRERYGAAPDIAGRSIEVNGAPSTIIGVVPERSGFPSTAGIWLPLPHHPDAHGWLRTDRVLSVFGRLRDDVAATDANEEIGALVDHLAREHPDVHARFRAHVTPINEQYLGSPTHPAWLAFMAAGCLIVLISCANVANLLLARSARRTREMAIRSSLGASRARIVRQLLVEAVVLAALGGVVGLAVAIASIRLFSSAIPEHVLPYWLDYTFDARVIAALAAVSAATVGVFALLPAVFASRTDVNQVLKDGQPSDAARGGRWSTLVVAGELALAVVLLAHLAAAMRTASPEPPAERALDTVEVVTAVLTLPSATYDTADRRQAFHDRLGDRLDGIPEVSASLTTALPLMGGERREVMIAASPTAAGEDTPTVHTVHIAPRYFSTLGVPLVSGRELVAADGEPGHDYAIINEPFVQRFLADDPALGQRIGLREPGSDSEPRWLTVVGLAPAIRQQPGQPPAPVVYLPYRTAPAADVSLVVRSSLETGALVSLLRAEVQAIDAHLPLYQVRTMGQVVRDADWNGRLSNRLFLYITAIAAALATAGLFTVAAYGVSTRTREIGLRIALGARSLNVIGLVVRRAAVQMALGFAAGLAFTRTWEWMFPAGLPGVRTTDPQSLAIVAAILVVMSLVACTFPARRAARIDPLTALRQE